MKRIPRLLLIAFALSLLVHLMVALVVRPATSTPQNQAEVVSIERRPATIAVTKVATPPPPPPPKRSPSPSTKASAPPRARNGPAEPAGTGNATSAPQAPVTPAAAPTATKTPNAGCVDASAGAAVAVSPSPPDIAPAVRADATKGVAVVKVQLDTAGNVTSADVAQSTGNSSLDLVAVSMARGARYTPALHDCKPIAASYAFSVKFVVW